MVHIAICDDETTHLENACAMMNQYAATRNIEIKAETFSSSSMLLDHIEAGTYHAIYLLDIYMPGVSGMSVATELRSKAVHSPIIFLTSSSEHAVEAFGVDATHYLLKPYAQQNFFAAMDKAVQQISSHTDKSIVLRIDGDYRSLDIDDIVYCRSDDNHQRIWQKDGTEWLVRMTATELYKMLEGFGCFHRCGRSYIINLSCISRIGVNSVTLKNGGELSLPRNASATLRSAFFSYFNR